MKTAIKITRPAITKLLVEAGFSKAEWQNRSSEKLRNDGFLISLYDLTIAGVTTYRLEVNHHLAGSWKDSAKPEIDVVTAQMFEAIQNAGIEAELIVSDYWLNSVRISY
jgi:hypothetical protein